MLSTGGSLGFVTGQSDRYFFGCRDQSEPGLHPFYAMVTDTGGKQYRTETKWLRIVLDTPFALSITAPPSTLTWTATAGRSYDL